jgi:hypothetical protein
MARLRDELRRAGGRRDATIAASVLWLSGLIWLGLIARYQWFGWAQMCASAALVLWQRYSRLQTS